MSLQIYKTNGKLTRCEPGVRTNLDKTEVLELYSRRAETGVGDRVRRR